MAKIKSKIDCCGSNFENNNITLLGLLTLSTPLALISGLVSLILFPLKNVPIIKSLFFTFKTLLNANLKLLDQYNLLPSARCSLAAFLSKLSPKFSQVTYNSFNFIIFTFVWLSFLTGASFIV